MKKSILQSRLRLFFAFAFALVPPARAQVLFSDDFESADPSCWSARPAAGCDGWTSIRDGGISLLAGGAVQSGAVSGSYPEFQSGSASGSHSRYGSHSGSKCIRIVFAKNEDYAGTIRTVSARHIFTRFYEYYDADFDFAGGMKIHRLSAYDEARQMNDFDIILFSQAAGGPDLCGPTDARYLNLAYNGGPVDWGLVGGVLPVERKRWYCIETEVKLNTPGKSDGEARIWVDGRLFAEKKGMNISGSVGSPINRVLFGGWYSSSLAGRNPCPDPDRPSIRYIDDVAIATSYIGTIPAVSMGPVPGSRRLTWTLPQGASAAVEYGTTSAYGARAAAQAQAQGVFTTLLAGLDSNRVYHYRVRAPLPGGGEYVSPDYAFSTAAGAAPIATRKPSRPVNLPPRLYDPIPD